MLDLGADPKSIEIARKHSVSQDFEVYEENWQTLIFFLDLDTQWNIVAGMAGVIYVGIPSQAIEAEMNIKGIPQDERIELRAAIKIMERAALTVLNKKDK